MKLKCFLDLKMAIISEQFQNRKHLGEISHKTWWRFYKKYFKVSIVFCH